MVLCLQNLLDYIMGKKAYPNHLGTGTNNTKIDEYKLDLAEWEMEALRQIMLMLKDQPLQGVI